MHDTRLHTEPEPIEYPRFHYGGFDKMTPIEVVEYYNKTGEFPPIVRKMVSEETVNLFKPEIGKRVFDRIIVKSSDSKSNNGDFPKEPWIYRDEARLFPLDGMDSFERWNQLSEKPPFVAIFRSLDSFIDEYGQMSEPKQRTEE